MGIPAGSAIGPRATGCNLVGVAEWTSQASFRSTRLIAAGRGPIRWVPSPDEANAVRLASGQSKKPFAPGRTTICGGREYRRLPHFVFGAREMSSRSEFEVKCHAARTVC